MPDPIVIEPISLPAPDFARFTFPRFRPLLTDTEPTASVDQRRPVLGVTINGRPIGLVLLSLPHRDRECRLLSLFVARPFRRQGLGWKLIRATEPAAIEAGARKLYALHASRMPHPEAYESPMKKAGWSAPRVTEYRIGGPASWAIEASRDWQPFLARIKRNGFSVTAWAHLTDTDRREIDDITTLVLPESDQIFHPFRTEHPNLIPALSLFVRREAPCLAWPACS